MRGAYSPERTIESKIKKKEDQQPSAHTGINSLVMFQEQELCHTGVYTVMQDPAGIYKIYTHFNNKAGRKKPQKNLSFAMLILINLLAF